MPSASVLWYDLPMVYQHFWNHIPQQYACGPTVSAHKFVYIPSASCSFTTIYIR